MKIQSHKAKMSQRKSALWDSSFEPTSKFPDMQEKEFSTK